MKVLSNIDSIQIHFNESQVSLLNFCLGFIMFGIALEIKAQDFKYIIQFPKAVISGLVSQWILLPIITLILIYILQPSPTLALGMILIAACPGGNISNYAVHLAKANVALSVVLTLISTLFCVFSTPGIFYLLKALLPETDTQYLDFEISLGAMVWVIIQLIIFPLILGLLFQKILPKVTQSIKGIVGKVSFIIFIGFVVFAVAGNFKNLINYVHIVFFIVFIHNALALITGYYWAKKIVHLPENDCRSISLETGIQNSGLALIIVFNFFDGNGGMALIAAWWSIWHILSALAASMYWRNKKHT
jgi:BASS family bile acid:Na+ symporter